MNARWARKRTGKLAAIAFLGFAATLSAFGQSATADSVQTRLRKVEDRQAIEQLLMGDYPRALDAANWAAYAALFTKDGTLIMNGGSVKKTGPAEIQAYFSNLRLPGSSNSDASSQCPATPGGHRFMHVVTNLTVQIDGDMATDQAYWETIVTRDCKSVVGGAGHYEDVLKREDGHWRFFKREIFDDLPPRIAQPRTGSSAPKP